MLKIIALVGLAAPLAFAPVAAVAQGATGYGTYGPQRGTSTFDRAWNASHLSKTYAYMTSKWPRHHYYYGPHHHANHNW